MPPKYHWRGAPFSRLSVHSKWPTVFIPYLASRRYASSSQRAAGSVLIRTRNLVIGTAIGLTATFGYFYVTDTRASVHRWLVVPVFRWLYPDPEDAHIAGNKALKGLYKLGWHPRERSTPDDDGLLKVEVFGHTIANPIGTSAGLDKNADIPSPLFELGPSIVEVGGVTPYPQDGNPRPRVFRLPSQRALINRYGLNSEGCDAVAMRLRHRLREFAYANGYGIDEDAEQAVLDGEAGVPPGSLLKGKLLAVQVAKNKFTPNDDAEAVKADYVSCVNALAKYADIVVVNVSSPNTPGLRDNQRVGPLTNILKGVVEAVAKVHRKQKPAVMVKVSPDEDTDEQVMGVCQAVTESGVDGVIVSNTTNRRPEPIPFSNLSQQEAAAMLEQGGYSGPQLFAQTVKLVRTYREILDRASLVDEDVTSPTDTLAVNVSSAQKPKVIFASGGITSGEDALKALNAGASVAMTYTALALGGVGTISRMKKEMKDAIRSRMK